jgi:hypothetical protein
MQIVQGAMPTAPKVMIYGLSGSGKSTLASKMKNPIFLDLEGGLNYLDVIRTPQITSLDEFYNVLVELYRAKKKLNIPDDNGGKKAVTIDTIVIDSVDWLVRKVVEKAAGIDKDHLEETLNRSNGGYGNGKQVLENHIRTKLLPTLVALNKEGYGICLIAHAERKDMMDAEGIDIERITPKIDTNTMNVFVEWVDNVLYLKNSNGERVLVLEGDDAVLAKNRLCLTGTVKLDDIDINELLTFKKGNK